jgi:hypothetical protein
MENQPPRVRSALLRCLLRWSPLDGIRFRWLVNRELETVHAHTAFVSMLEEGVSRVPGTPGTSVVGGSACSLSEL